MSPQKTSLIPQVFTLPTDGPRTLYQDDAPPDALHFGSAVLTEEDPDYQNSCHLILFGLARRNGCIVGILIVNMSNKSFLAEIKIQKTSSGILLLGIHAEVVGIEDIVTEGSFVEERLARPETDPTAIVSRDVEEEDYVETYKEDEDDARGSSATAQEGLFDGTEVYLGVRVRVKDSPILRRALCIDAQPVAVSIRQPWEEHFFHSE